jgi:hypothetical protein
VTGDTGDVLSGPTAVTPATALCSALTLGLTWSLVCPLLVIRGMRSSGDRQVSRVIDRCIVCLQPIYEGGANVLFFGLYVHLACYYCEIDGPYPQSTRQSKAA